MDTTKTSKRFDLHKFFKTTPGEGLQPKEVISYSLAGLGQNIICALVSSFSIYYFTNGLKIDPILVGLILLFIRLFDALNDPIMGSIVDKTQTKDGKFRPYLKHTAIPIAVLTVLLFLPFPTAEGSAPTPFITIFLVVAIYLVWSIVYTVIDVPYWGLSTSLSNETHQRGVTLTVARLLCTIGAGVVGLLVPVFTGAWTSGFFDDQGQPLPGTTDQISDVLKDNFWILVLVLSAISVPLFYLGFKNTKERFFNKEDVRPLKENLKLLFKNKPLVLIVISGILGSAKMIYMYANMYLAQYNIGAVLGDTKILGMAGVGLATIITLSNVPGGLVATVLVPWCTRKFGKRNTFIYSHIFAGLVMIAMTIVGWDTPAKLAINLVGLILVGVAQGFSNILTYAMIADTVEYTELHEGKRAEGICFAMQTFISKIGMAIGAAVFCFGLGWSNIDVNVESTWGMANKEGLNVLYLVCILVPGISMLLSVIPLFFYKFNEKEQTEAVAVIMARKGIDRHGNKVAE
ncbi:MAG: glycoside-pentoside-hexuronide (GPH):cation symporter [Clostridiales bacterium]|jgi:sugar (glycoside-pentoside-hexuronide) transporter|nr:glycoside-pentoside-hexuronide (GPH):cation symporter [Clostridiales bacterium]